MLKPRYTAKKFWLKTPIKSVLHKMEFSNEILCIYMTQGAANCKRSDFEVRKKGKKFGRGHFFDIGKWS